METKEVVIVGGGPAGLTAAIHLARHGIPVKVFEKESYPHHKVCGEYLSKEVLPYLDSLGVRVRDLGPANILHMEYSTRAGKLLRARLPLGGFGLSRYALDNLLFRKALENGVVVRKEKVTNVYYDEGGFCIGTQKGEHRAAFVLGAYGKRDTMDKNLGRNFIRQHAPWVAIKSHFEHPSYPDELVGLHNFKGGYCGLSKTESGVVNVCYLASYESFRKYGHPERFLEEVLRKNPNLDKFFTEATALFQRPLSIAQVSFAPKESVKNHVLMIGDTAGLIHPLCGNGIAMAIESARMAAELVIENGERRPARDQLERLYQTRWKQAFQARLRTGRWLQRLLLRDTLARVSQEILLRMPMLLPGIIARTHGKPVVNGNF